MPRYYFYIDDSPDDSGVELPDEEAARSAAVETFGAMIRDGSVNAQSHMRVTDDAGRRVVSLRFSAER